MNLSDLRVHYRPENALPRQVKQRPATVADVRDVLLTLGAEVEEWCVEHDQRDVYHDGCSWAQRDADGRGDCVLGKVIVWRVPEEKSDV